MFDKRKVQCYSCNKFNYFSTGYWSNKVRKGEESNLGRGDFDDEPMLLMASVNVGGLMVNWWHMDTSCSNNLIRKRQ